MPFTLLIITLFSTLWLTACQNIPTKAHPSQNTQNTSRSALPNWVLHPPSDTQQFMFGSGEGMTRQQAIQSALADLSSRLGITVSASFQTELRVQNRGYELTERDSKKNIQTQSTPITINQYQVVETYAPLPTKIFVLIKTNKQQLAQGYQDTLNQQIAHFQSKLKQLAKKGHLERYLGLQPEKKALPKFKQTLATLKSLQPHANFKTYNRYIAKLEKTLMQDKQQIHFSVIPLNNESQPFTTSIKDKLAADNLLSASSKSPIQIRLKTQTNKSRAYGFYINRYQVNLSLWDHNKQINGTTLNIKGQSGQDSQTALIQAQKRFKNTFNLNQLLGL